MKPGDVERRGTSSAGFVVIIGCGRLGAHLAETYSRRGASVVIVDPDPESLKSLSAEYSGFTVEGDATEVDVLRQAKTGEADLFVAASEDDNINLMAAQVATRVFQVRRVIARVYSPQLVDFVHALGIEVVSPTLLAADRLLAYSEEVP